jgi:hypothetical protein
MLGGSEIQGGGIGKLDFITPNDISANPALHEIATNPGMSAHEYVQNLGFQPQAWDMIQQQMHADYPDTFIDTGNGVITIKAGLLPDNAAADLFNRLENVRLTGLETSRIISPNVIANSGLKGISILPPTVGTPEQFMQTHGLGHAWLELNNPATASQLASAAPSAFSYQGGVLALLPDGQITNNAWSIITQHMNKMRPVAVFE